MLRPECVRYSSGSLRSVSMGTLSADSCSRPGLDALFIEELLDTLFAAVFGIAELGLVEFCVEIVFALFPGKFAAALETVLGRAQARPGFFPASLRASARVSSRRLIKRHSAVDEPHFSSLAAGECIAGHDVFKSLAMANGVGQGFADQIARRNSPIDFGEAEDSAFRRNGEIASDQRRKAPPKHQPLTIAMVGLGYMRSSFHCHVEASRRIFSWYVSGASSISRKYSFKSIPADHDSPAPVIINTLAASSSSSVSSTLPISRLSVGLIALRFSGG